jgi:hypothetical protein
MLNRDKIEQLEREHRRSIIAHGKSRFIRREVGFSVVFFALLMSFLYFFSARSRSGLIACLVVLPIGILGGYLHARWKWQDIKKQVGD